MTINEAGINKNAFEVNGRLLLKCLDQVYSYLPINDYKLFRSHINGIYFTTHNNTDCFMLHIVGSDGHLLAVSSEIKLPHPITPFLLRRKKFNSLMKYLQANKKNSLLLKIGEKELLIDNHKGDIYRHLIKKDVLYPEYEKHIFNNCIVEPVLDMDTKLMQTFINRYRKHVETERPYNIHLYFNDNVESFYLGEIRRHGLLTQSFHFKAKLHDDFLYEKSLKFDFADFSRFIKGIKTEHFTLWVSKSGVRYHPIAITPAEKNAKTHTPVRMLFRIVIRGSNPLNE